MSAVANSTTPASVGDDETVVLWNMPEVDRLHPLSYGCTGGSNCPHKCEVTAGITASARGSSPRATEAHLGKREADFFFR